MRAAKQWTEYELLDTSEGEKLERWGDTVLIRPDPQVIWSTPKDDRWNRAHARYVRSASGGGSWDNDAVAEKQWQIAYGDLRFHIRPTGFKHTGLFPEQAVNWDFMREKISTANRPVKVLNLFAYTGGATVACAAAGAEVVHVDASKGMVSWAHDNAILSGLGDKPIRWIVDDCKKFVEREIRRGNRYQGIIMDPPSYGRGPGGELWKLEDAAYELIALCSKLLADDALFFLVNSYTTGLSASVMEYILGVTIRDQRGGALSSDEIGLPVSRTGYVLPCGNTAIWQG
jgi:23S rRNA (cytosine1962-C5)-methyltransferase